MTDVRAILEEESRSLRRRDRWIKGFCLFVALLTVLTTVSAYLRERSIGNAIGQLVPLFCFTGIAAAYSPRHRAALQAALSDPDPALDVHFAMAMVAEETDVATLGRKVFLERFHDRLPVFDPVGWTAVAGALLHSTAPEAESLLALLKAGGTSTTLARIEAYAENAKAERLRTAALQTMGEIRLRAARTIVESAMEREKAEVEVQRLRIGP